MASDGPISSRGISPYKQQSTSSKTIEEDPTSQRFVIGKIDAGIAVLISDSVHLIEFPSLLLPSGVGPGSIVNIACTRNLIAEREANTEFWDLQQSIFELYGQNEPSPPELKIRNTTQTSVTLEWETLQLAQAELLSLSIWRNGQRLTTIPNPLTNTSTKLSGLSLDTDYTFHLVMKTTAGTFTSALCKTRTHTINQTEGISVCFGLVEPEDLLVQAKTALETMGAKQAEKIQIDTTHFVATSPASKSNPKGGPSVEYQKALQLSIPVVSPEWILACAREKKMVPISQYYIGTVNTAASLSSANLPSLVSRPSALNNSTRRQTIGEEDETGHAIPSVAPSVKAHTEELADEEPDAPPETETSAAEPDAPIEEVPEKKLELEQAEEEEKQTRHPDTPEINIVAPDQEEGEEEGEIANLTESTQTIQLDKLEESSHSTPIPETLDLQQEQEEPEEDAHKHSEDKSIREGLGIGESMEDVGL